MRTPLHDHQRAIWGRLDSAWRRASDQWRDGVHDRFEREHWHPLLRDVEDYQHALERFEQTLRRAQEEVARWYQ